MAWACQIAWWRIRYSRQKFARAKVVFDEETFEAVARTAGEMAVELDERHEALVGGPGRVSLDPQAAVLFCILITPNIILSLPVTDGPSLSSAPA